MKIAITGPESSGKTTLAIDLASELGIGYIPEFARFHLQESGPSYALKDLEWMANQHTEWCQRAGDAFISDGDYFVFKVWEEVRFSSCSLQVNKLNDRNRFDLYLLCKPDLEWSYDPLREDEDSRPQLYERYKELLQENNLPFAVISGENEARLQRALDAITAHRKGAP